MSQLMGLLTQMLGNEGVTRSADDGTLDSGRRSALGTTSMTQKRLDKLRQM